MNPTPGAVVTPNMGLGLSEGAGDSRASAGGEGVEIKELRGFFSVAGVAAPNLVPKVLGVVDHAEGPALACPNGETVDAKDKKPLCFRRRYQ